MGIEIPGKTTMFRTIGIPPIDVALPLVAYTSRTPLIFLGLMYSALGFEFTLGIYLIVTDLQPSDTIPAIIMLLVMFAMATPFWMVGLTLLGETTRSGSVLTVDEECLVDTRAKVVIRWLDVVEAGFLYSRRGGPLAVRLTLGAAMQARESPFRLDTLFRRRKGNEVQIAIKFLDIDTYTLSHVIAALIARAGGRISVGPPKGW